MSDFKMIKCPKCQASTAQKVGELLLKCPQCSYQIIKQLPKKKIKQKTLSTAQEKTKNFTLNTSSKKGNFAKTLIIWVIIINIIRYFNSN